MRARRFTTITGLLLTFLAQPVIAAWIPMADADPAAPAEVRVDGSPDRLEMVYDLPGFQLVDTPDGLVVDLPGRTPRQVAGRPELPMVPVTLAVPDGGTPILEILEHRVREVPVATLVVSYGHLSRRLLPEGLERPAALPSDGPWPAAAAELAAVFDAAGSRGATVRLNPVRYDAARGLLLVTEHIRLVLATPDVQPSVSRGTPELADVRRRLFANTPEPLDATAKTLVTAPRMLVVVPAALAGGLDAFVDWKARRGLDVEVRTYEELGGSAAAVQDAVALRYADAGGLAWLLLVGDVAQVPSLAASTPGVLSDQRYGMVDGDDLHPDVLVSRLPARSISELAVQSARIVAYERDATAGDPWFARAAGVASAEGSPADHERADELRDKLLEHGFTAVDRIYETDGAGAGDVADALESGRSLVNYLGHGSGTAWQSVPFDVADVTGLDNSGHWPWVVDASCSNGDLSLNTCLAEAWLRAGSAARPGGAVGVFAATSEVPWTPPTLLQQGVVEALTVGGERSLGALCHAGLAKVLEIYAGLPVATTVIEQYTLFGDASLQVRTRAPGTFVVGTPGALDAGDATWELDVDGPAGTVVALSWNGALYGRGVGDGTGMVTVDLLRPFDGLESLDLTITGPDMAAHLDTLPLQLGTSAVMDVPPAGPRLLGNHPNPFNPSTTIAYELAADGPVTLDVYDTAGRRVRRLLQGVVLDAGRAEIVWDGRDDRGRRAGSGVYLYRLVTTGGEAVGRMTLVK
ncbi:MAG: hypothetical protein GY838_01520 [bacterium]|nr:hypothetical protein [bacterium]